MARAAVHRRQTHYVAERDLCLEDMAVPPDCQPAYRHPRVRKAGPLSPGCVVVVDIPVDRGCPILSWPPFLGEHAPPVRRDTLCFRGGTTLLVVATVYDSVFAVSSSGLYGWVLNDALRHLAVPPGGADSLPYHPYPSLPPV